jgi:hypothetical protein
MSFFIMVSSLLPDDNLTILSTRLEKLTGVPIAHHISFTRLCLCKGVLMGESLGLTPREHPGLLVLDNPSKNA